MQTKKGLPSGKPFLLYTKIMKEKVVHKIREIR